ncbi:hypothetical protein [Cohnella algarum]|uniref:hypothetical protein n=1 Tax=Cohnella algarum TaxID=2044859 RepID=UPI0030846A00
MKALIDKNDFIGLERCSWFYSGAETPTHREVLKAVTEYMTVRSLGPGGRDRNAETERSCKRNLAELLGSRPEHIALMSSSSEAISMISRALALAPGTMSCFTCSSFRPACSPGLRLNATAWRSESCSTATGKSTRPIF